MSDVGTLKNNKKSECASHLAESLAYEDTFDYWCPPTLSAPIVVGSPHSGRRYHSAFVQNSRLPLNLLRSSEDAFLDGFLRQCKHFNIANIAAHYPRAYVDLNRAPTEIDTSLLATPRPDWLKVTPTPRSRNGLGVIPSVVSHGMKIYRRKLTIEDVSTRLSQIYNPYHQALADLLGAVHAQFKHVLLVDLHSMPSQARHGSRLSDADIVIGDRFGASCSPQIVQLIKRHFQAQGLKVSVNHPYAGGFITEFYNRPSLGFETVQIELSRRLYMDEGRIKPHDGFNMLNAILTGLWNELISFYGSKADQRNTAPPFAAE